MKLNGWQRLWVVLAALWAIVIAGIAWNAAPMRGSDEAALLALWAVPVAFVYALGWSAAWVKRGFGQR